MTDIYEDFYRDDRWRLVRATSDYAIFNRYSHDENGDRIREYPLTASSRKRLERLFGWNLERYQLSSSGIIIGQWE